MNKGSGSCIFCKIAGKEIAVKAEYEDDSVMAFDDKNPQAPVHVLIISKKHIASLNDITGKTAGLLGNMTIAAKEIAKRRDVLDAGYRLVVNCGRDSGQAVDHLHMHLLGGRQLGWPPG